MKIQTAQINRRESAPVISVKSLITKAVVFSILCASAESPNAQTTPAPHLTSGATGGIIVAGILVGACIVISVICDCVNSAQRQREQPNVTNYGTV